MWLNPAKNSETPGTNCHLTTRQACVSLLPSLSDDSEAVAGRLTGCSRMHCHWV